jgi:hypothetical protein
MSSLSIEQPAGDNAKSISAKSSSAAEQAGISIANPLLNPEVLELTLSFLQGEGLFAVAVSKRWKACYDELPVPSTSVQQQHVHTSTCTAIAAAFGSPSRVTFAHAAGFQLQAAGWKLQECAGKHCSAETLKVAYALGLLWNDNLSRAAAEAANLPALQWLHTELNLPLPTGIAENAARGGSIDILRWLKQQQQCVFDENTTYYGALRANNMPVLQYLHSEGVPWHDSVCGAAAAACDLQQLQWLRSKGGRLSNRVANDAASGGSVPIFVWLQQHGVQFTLQTMLEAAENGRTELCQWLRAVADCEWSAEVCDVAAAYGHVDTLRWLCANGCPVRPHTVCYNAVIGCGDAPPIAGESHIMHYLIQPGTLPGTDGASLLLNIAGAKGKLRLAQWLRHGGGEWPTALWYPEVGPWTVALHVWARSEGCDSPLVPVETDTDTDDDSDSDSDSDSEQGDEQ